MTMMQRLRKISTFVLGPHTACRFITFPLLLVLIVIGLPALSGAQQTCQPDGDVDQNGSVTAADALLVFQQALSLAQLSACQLSIADVFPQPVTPDGYITASDALCIFQKALSLPSCLDSVPSSLPLREMVFDNPGPKEPSYVIAGNNASLQYWTDQFGEVSQSLYESANGREVVRTFYDPVTGAATTMLNEASGHYLSIRENGPNRVDFWTFDGNGAYLGGFAVLKIYDTYSYGEIVGEPTYSGKQINGELNPTIGSWTGSFTLIADSEEEEGGLANVQPLPPGLTTFIDGLVPDTTAARDEEDNSPIVASLSFNLYRGFVLAGTVLLGAGVVASAPALIVAGGAALMVTQILPVLADEVRTKLGDSCPTSDDSIATLCAELGNLAANQLANENDVSLVNGLQDMNAWIEEKPDRILENVNRGNEYLENISDLLQDDYIGEENPVEPASLMGPPMTSNNLSGTANRQDGTSVSIQGTIGPDGAFNVSGIDGEDSLELEGVVDIDGNPIDGTFDWGTDEGDIQEQFEANTPYAMCLAYMPLDVYRDDGYSREYTFIRWTTVNLPGLAGVPSLVTVDYEYEIKTINPPSNFYPSGHTGTFRTSDNPLCFPCAASGNFFPAEDPLDEGSQTIELPCSEFSTYAHETILHGQDIRHDSSKFVYRNFTCSEVFYTVLCDLAENF